MTFQTLMEAWSTDSHQHAVFPAGSITLDARSSRPRAGASGLRGRPAERPISGGAPREPPDVGTVARGRHPHLRIPPDHDPRQGARGRRAACARTTNIDNRSFEHNDEVTWRCAIEPSRTAAAGLRARHCGQRRDDPRALAPQARLGKDCRPVRLDSGAAAVANPSAKHHVDVGSRPTTFIAAAAWTAGQCRSVSRK